MKSDCSHEVMEAYVAIRAAMSLFDGEGIDISSILLKQDTRLWLVFDAMGTAIYQAHDRLEEIALTPTDAIAALNIL